MREQDGKEVLVSAGNKIFASKKCSKVLSEAMTKSPASDVWTEERREVTLIRTHEAGIDELEIICHNAGQRATACAMLALTKGATGHPGMGRASAGARCEACSSMDSKHRGRTAAGLARDHHMFTPRDMMVSSKTTGLAHGQERDRATATSVPPHRM